MTVNSATASVAVSQSSPAVPGTSGTSTTGPGQFRIPRRPNPFSRPTVPADLGKREFMLSSNGGKYTSYRTDVNFNSRAFLPTDVSDLDFLACKLESLVLTSASVSTWNKHTSAVNSYLHFFDRYCTGVPWPCTLPNVRAYTVWALTVRKLKPATVKNYLSCIEKSQLLKGLPFVNFCNDKIISMAITGAENVAAIPSNIKISVNPPMMRILCHKLADCNWTEYSKQVVWSCFLLAFFTSCRMGEIVSSEESSFDQRTALTWQNIEFLDDNSGAVVFLPFTKTKKFNGDFLDIFHFKIPTFCPVTNLIRLKKMQKDLGIFSTNEPVFKFKSGLLLTKSKVNELLASFLNCTGKEGKVTAHSFRSSIPTMISEKHSISNEKGRAKLWGRWSSETYKLYTKNVRTDRYNIYLDICTVLYEYWK